MIGVTRLCLLFALAADGGPWVVDRLVAAIAGRPLTLSELDLEARVVLVRQGALHAAQAPLDEDLLVRVLDYVITQSLVVHELDRLKLDEVEGEEVRTQVRGFASRFESPAAYQSFLARQDVAEEALAAIFRRDLRVARYVERRVRLQARVEDSEVRAYLDAHADEVAGMDRGAAADAVRAKLSRERAAEVTRREMAEVRARHQGEVRLVAPFTRRLRPGEAGTTKAGERTP